MKIRSILIKSFVFFATILFFPQAAFGIGQTTDPIILKDALRGSTFQKEVIVVNTEKESFLIDIKEEGDIAGWVKFFKMDDLKNPINAVYLKAGERINLFAQITIPIDIQNGKYSGFISVIQKPKSEVASEGSSSSVSQKIDRKIDIEVSDKENISVKASVIPEKYDLEENESLKVRLIYDNQGNVAVKPDINLKIKKDEKILFSISYSFAEGIEAIKPMAVFEVPSIEIPVSTLEKGRYVAEFDFVVDKEVVSTRRVKFTIGEVLDKGEAGSKSILAMALNGNYKNWIIPGLTGIFVIVFAVYGFHKTKKKKSYVKRKKINF